CESLTSTTGSRCSARLWSNGGSTAGSATSTSASAASAAGRGERVSHKLCRRSGCRGCGHRHEDELASLMNVGHRDAGLHSGHRDLRNVFTGLLIVGVEKRIRAVAGKEQRLSHHESNQSRATGFRNTQALK